MAYNGTADQALRNINKDGNGRPYENMMSETMAAYCLKNGLDYRTVIGTREDEFGGTDFKVCDSLDIITASSGILRLDFTTAFSEKDNMPLIWTPQQPIEQLNGRPLMFGIRTGNTRRGFDYPVIVIGIDAGNNKNPDDDVDVGFAMNALRARTAKNAGAIISEAGAAMARYIYATNPAYQAWLETDEGQDAFFPDYDGLSPNFGGAKGFITGRKSHETIAGLRLAKELATDYMVQYTAGTHEFEMARAFAQKCYEKAKPSRHTKPRTGTWMQQLDQFVKESEAYDKPEDGLTR